MRCHAHIGALRCALEESHADVRIAMDRDPFPQLLTVDVAQSFGFVTNHIARNGWTFTAYREGSTWVAVPYISAEVLMQNPDFVSRLQRGV